MAKCALGKVISLAKPVLSYGFYYSRFKVSSPKVSFKSPSDSANAFEVWKKSRENPNWHFSKSRVICKQIVRQIVAQRVKASN